MKVGVFGGTFDPVHNGHIAVAQEVRFRLALDEVLFIPTGQPWFRPGHPVASAADRVAMLSLGLDMFSYFQLSTIEVDRPGPSYSVDTMAALRQQRPADQFFFIMGWDNLSDLPHWKEPARLIDLCRMVGVPRPGYPPPDLALLDKSLPGLAEKVVLLDQPRVDISASAIRNRVALGLSIARLVPEPVDRYIRQKRLYQNVESS